MLAVVYCLRVWEHYLKAATPFKIKMDNRAVSYHQSQKKLSSKQARWLDYLAKFKYKLEYSLDKTNIVADTLSHKNVVASVYAIEGLLLECIKEGFQHDDRAQTLIELANEAKTKRFWLENRVFYAKGQ